MVCVIIFDAVGLILLVARKGIMKDKRTVLMEKTNAELRSMLNGCNKISRLNKKELVDMIVSMA